uniref:G_PROTEIN_RECEP_F1_2 domain-containing protein n=1 Tax=Onchocerca volvulus TaxID=6282 RepID=A0A8R1XVV5_ONCVO
MCDRIYWKIIQLAFIGLFAYGLSLYFICKSPRYHNTFGILCFAYVLFHIQTIGALIIWTVFRIIANMGLISLPWRTFSRIFSPLANSTLFAAIWMQLVLAINRFWAISRPMTYDRVFNPKNARIIVVSLWLFSILITALYYNVDKSSTLSKLKNNLKYQILTEVECKRYVEADFHSWSTLFGPCKHFFLTYIAVSLSDGIFLVVLIVNAIASYYIIAYLQLQKKKHQGAKTQQKMGQEIVFFKEFGIRILQSALVEGTKRSELPHKHNGHTQKNKKKRT